MSKLSLTSKEKESSDEMADSAEAKTIVSGGLDAADGGCGLKMEACSNVSVRRFGIPKFRNRGLG